MEQELNRMQKGLPMKEAFLLCYWAVELQKDLLQETVH